MPTLLDNAPQSLSAASAQLAALRHRMIQMLEWFAALVVLAVVLLLTESVALAGSVGAGAITALVICGLAVDERRRLVLSLVAMGDANSIPEVGALAERLAHDPAERRRVAASLRTAVGAGRPGVVGYRAPMVVAPGRVALYAPRLLALADAIGDLRVSVSPSGRRALPPSADRRRRLAAVQPEPARARARSGAGGRRGGDRPGRCRLRRPRSPPL